MERLRVNRTPGSCERRIGLTKTLAYTIRGFIERLIRRLLALLSAPILLLLSCVARLKKRNENPRLIWGPTPIISIKYLSQAARSYGYKSQTLVYGFYPINRREDFDLGMDDFIPRIHLFGLNPFRMLGFYIIFAWALFTQDIFHFFFDGGFLSGTPLRFLECQLLKLACKKVVVMPYGSDIAVMSKLEEMDRDAWLQDYPSAQEKDAAVMKQVRYFAKWADFVIGCGNQLAGFQPRQDLLLFSYIPIDSNHWSSTGTFSQADGHDGEVTVIHTPNHRAIKGTDLLVEAVRQLQEEGVRVRLEVMEGQTNDAVRIALERADILAEQFLGGYALSAVEGMSLGKPVLSNLSRHPPETFENTFLGECPIVNTPPEKIKENLKALIENPELRRELGMAGRRYVERHHSLEAVGGILNKIYHNVWFGEEADCVRGNCFKEKRFSEGRTLL